MLSYHDTDQWQAVTDKRVVPPKFQRRLFHEFFVERQGLEFHPCGGRRWPPCVRTKKVRGCHFECFEFGGLLSGNRAIPEPSLFSRGPMVCSFEPPESEKERRRRFIRARLEEKLAADYACGKLSPEIWRMIADLLVRECAIVTSMISRQLLGSSTFGASLVNLSRDIYASFVTMDGVHYFKSLGNSPDPVANSVRVWKARAGSIAIQVEVYFAEDYLGIRKLCFVVGQGGKMWSMLSRAADIGIRWRRFSSSSSGAFKVLTDVRLGPPPFVSTESERSRWRRNDLT